MATVCAAAPHDGVVPVVSRRIVIRFADEELLVGASSSILGNRMAKLKALLDADRCSNATAAAAAGLIAAAAAPPSAPVISLGARPSCEAADALGAEASAAPAALRKALASVHATVKELVEEHIEQQPLIACSYAVVLVVFAPSSRKQQF